MFDFSTLQTNSEHPAAWAILLTVLFSFSLSCIIVLTYDLTTKAIKRPYHFLQSLTLISIVAATVMQAVGDSLARGLGMLGALAIIRFRTTLRDPRNMTFMFASLAAGIACGVQGYVIAVIGTIIFCIGAFILRFSSFFDKKELIGTLKLELPKKPKPPSTEPLEGEAPAEPFIPIPTEVWVKSQKGIEQEIKQIIQKYCKSFELREYVVKANNADMRYYIKLREDMDSRSFVNALQNIHEQLSVRLTYNKPVVEL